MSTRTAADDDTVWSAKEVEVMMRMSDAFSHLKSADGKLWWVEAGYVESRFSCPQPQTKLERIAMAKNHLNMAKTKVLRDIDIPANLKEMMVTISSRIAEAEAEA